MADPLKDMIRSLYRGAGFDEETINRKIEGDLKEVPCDLLMGRTPRYAMQTLGGDWGRAMIDENFWVHQWKSRRSLVPGLVVVDDVRYDNEGEAVWDLGGLTVEVDRGLDPVLTGEASAHASENGIKPELVHFTIDNSGPPASLYEALSEIVYVHYYGDEAHE